MVATRSGHEPATDATQRSLVDFAVLDTECAKRGALSESARAKLLDVDRITLWRWRTGRQQISYQNAIRIADQLGVGLDALSGRAA